MTKHEKIVRALTRLVGHGTWQVHGETIKWDEGATPSPQADIDAEIARLESPEYEVEKWRETASLSRRRFKIGEALYQVNGTPLVELIEALLAGLPEPDKTIAGIAYRESAQFDRLDPFILQFSQALGMSEEQTDEFFRFCLEEQWNQ